MLWYGRLLLVSHGLQLLTHSLAPRRYHTQRTLHTTHTHTHRCEKAWTLLVNARFPITFPKSSVAYITSPSRVSRAARDVFFNVSGNPHLVGNSPLRISLILFASPPFEKKRRRISLSLSPPLKRVRDLQKSQTLYNNDLGASQRRPGRRARGRQERRAKSE